MHIPWQRIESCLPQLWRAVRGYEADPGLQEDLMQEVLLAIWDASPRLRDPDRLLPFALRIAHNLGASHVRNAVRNPRRLSLDAEFAEPLVAPDADPANQVGAALAAAVRALPLPLRQVLLLQLEGFDYEEIADTLGLTSSNVGVRAHRARKLLQEALDGR